MQNREGSERFNDWIMRVAFVVNRFPELSETFILNQITGLLDAGHDVRIFAKPVPVEGKLHPVVEEYNLMKRVHYRAVVPSNKTICRLKALGMIAAAFLRSPVRTLKTLKLLISREEGFSYKLLFFILPILRRSFNIIHCHYGPNGNLGVHLKRIVPKMKLITMFHGYDILLGLEKGHAFYDDLFKYADRLLANSEYSYKSLLALGADADKTMIHPVGIDLERFKFQGGRVSKEDLGQITIMTVARFVEEKGLVYGIRAFGKLVEQNPERDLVYKLIGNGILEEQLKGLVQQLSLQDKVIFMGSMEQAEVIKNLGTADIFLLPSINEGFGMVLLEAQAIGLPIVSTLAGGIPEAVKWDESAFLVPEKDVDALAERLEYLVKHPDLWPEMGRAGREYVEKNYNIKDLNQKLVRIYQELLAQKD